MEKKIIERFLGKKVILHRRYAGDTGRTTFKLYCEVRDVTEETVVIFTDRLGAILLEDIVSIEELKTGGDAY